MENLFNMPVGVSLAYLVMIIQVIVGQVVFNQDAIEGAGYSYVQPDGVTFSIWGIIYFYQAVFCIVQQFMPSIRNDEKLIKARPYIIGYFLLSGFWLIVNGVAVRKGLLSHWAAVVTLVASTVYLFNAYYIVAPLEQNNWSERYYIWTSKKNFQRRWLIIYPISINAAWVFLASNLNFANTLFDNNYNFPTAIGGIEYAIGIAFAATVINIHLQITRYDFAYTFTTVWALLGIHRNQTKENSDMPQDQEQSQRLAESALLCVGLAVGGLVFTNLVALGEYMIYKNTFTIASQNDDSQKSNLHNEKNQEKGEKNFDINNI